MDIDQTYIELLKILGTIAGPLIAAMFAMRKYHMEMVRERRARAIDMHRDLKNLKEHLERVDDAFPARFYKNEDDSVSLNISPTPLDEILRKIENPSIKTSLQLVLSHFETVSIAVASEAADEDTVFETMNVLIFRYSLQFSEFIRYRQETEHISIYVYLSELRKRWAPKMRNYKPIFV